MDRRPRSAGYFFGALSLVLVVLLAVFALTQRQPPPPTIAEFAPQAVESITDVDTSKSSSSGTGEGDCAGQGPCANGTGDGPGIASPVPTIVPAVRRCFGDPPRQTEDPQSPPCVPYWAGDNGGTTARGVTRDEIRIAVPEYDASFTPLFEAFFNRRFEFYGRRLRLLNNNARGGSTDPAVQRASAVDAKAMNIFASTGYQWEGGQVYAEELVHSGIPTIQMNAGFGDDLYAANAPYIWSYYTALNRQLANLGEWSCHHLVGGTADFAGPSERGKPRVYGVVLGALYSGQSAAAQRLTSEPLRERLSRCGASLVAEEKMESQNYADPAAQGGLENSVLRMRQAGVTTVFAFVPTIATPRLMATATNQAYYPEWPMSTYFRTDENWVVRSLYPASQRTQVFGLTFAPKQQPPERMPAYWALREQGYTSTPRTTIDIYWKMLGYREALLLASGVQMAGPRLTVETFAKALHQTHFPNPDDPIMAGRVGFEDGDYTMQNDAAQMWWSETEHGPYPDDAGTLCYVNGGTRNALGTWDAAPKGLFQLPCGA